MFWSATEAMVRNLSGAKLTNARSNICYFCHNSRSQTIHREDSVNKAGARVRLKGSYPNSQAVAETSDIREKFPPQEVSSGVS